MKEMIMDNSDTEYSKCCNGEKPKYNNTGLCKDCFEVEYQKQYEKLIVKQKHKEARNLVKNDPVKLMEFEKKVAHEKYKKRSQTEEYKRYTKNRSLIYKYNITLEVFEEMRAAQNNKCAICNREAKMIRKGSSLNLYVDHCHKSGKIRGLLCSSCNVYIARIDYDIETLARLNKYFKKEDK